jgi:hypothetical protein
MTLLEGSRVGRPSKYREIGDGKQAGDAEYPGHFPQCSAERTEQHYPLPDERVKLTGRIRSFDKYSVVLETNNQEQLIFKHAISTVAVAKAHGFSEKPRVVSPAPASESGNHPPPLARKDK